MTHSDKTQVGSLKKTVKDITITFIRQFLSGLLQLGIIFLIARTLGPEGAGVYTVALLLPTVMAQILNLGLASSNVYYGASGRFQLEQIWSLSYKFVFVMIVIGLIFGATLILLWGESLFKGVHPEYLYEALLVYPPLLMTSIVLSLLQAIQNFKHYNILITTQPFALLAFLTILAISQNFDLQTIVLATATSHFAATLFGIILLKRNLKTESSAYSENYLMPALRYGLQSHLSNLISFIAYRMDIFMVNLLLGPFAAGLYTIAVRIAEQLWIISQAVTTVILPRLAAMHHSESGHRHMAPMIARMVLWSTTISAIIIALVAKPMIQLIFGAQFEGAIYPLWILLLGTAVFSCARVLANDLSARGLVRFNLLLSIGSLIINFIGNLFWIPHVGICGAATATTTAYALNLIIRLVLQSRLSGVPWHSAVLLTKNDFVNLKSIFTRRRDVGKNSYD